MTTIYLPKVFENKVTNTVCRVVATGLTVFRVQDNRGLNYIYCYNCMPEIVGEHSKSYLQLNVKLRNGKAT